tara:strand:+ start:10103 stop:10720 length:618 start_codon:yes stop_codon:yes gene_type:complete
MQKAFYISLIQLSILFGAPKIHPVVKSLMVPGWGEASLGHQKSSRFFIHSEAILLVGCLSAYKIGDIKQNEYIAFANEHAGAKIISDHRYWVDIGNYNSNQVFDEEHLRMRDGKQGKWSSAPWLWENGDSYRKRFEKMRIDSDKLFFTGKFIIGGIILNHIVSGINTLYLTRINNKKSYSISPSIEMQNNDIRYLFKLELDIKNR